MNIIIVKDYQEMSQKAAKFILNQLAIKSDSIFGLATGSTPIGMYQKIIKAHQKYDYDFSRVKTFNLDEYIGLDKKHEQSYNYFMCQNLFSQINIKQQNIYIPDGAVKDISKHCQEYENKIQKSSIDIQVLGIGANGHVGFNEPGSSVNSQTRVVGLDKKTIQDNSRFFKNKKDVPKQAVTMGIETILSAKKIIILASGKNKAQAIKQMVEGKISSSCPASFLQNHPDVYVIIDKQAASLLKKQEYKKNGWSEILVLNENILPKNEKVLIISPHHDDSAVSCGAMIKALAKDNDVYTLVMTAGYRAAMPELTKSEKIKARLKEAQAESKILGSKLLFGNFKFYDQQKKFWQDDLKKFAKIYNKIKPDIVLLPHTKDDHPTHLLSTELVMSYFKQKYMSGVELWFYEGLWSQHLLPTINLIFGYDKKLLNFKNKALAKHESQITRLPLIKASQALTRFRATTLPEQRFVAFGQNPPHIGDYVEAYYRVAFAKRS